MLEANQAHVETLRSSDWFGPDGFPLAFELRDPQEPFGLHNHEFCEIVVITGGHGLHVTGNESWPIVAGDVFVITGDRPHDYENMEKLALFNILFQPELLRINLLDLALMPGYHALFKLEPAWRESHEFKSRLHLAPLDMSTVTALADRLNKELTGRETGFQFMASAIFMEIVGFLSRCYSRCSRESSQGLLRIANAITHLETNYAKSVDVDGLAEIANMSKRSFMRAFKKATGLSAISYLVRVRIAKAVDLLHDKDLSIAKVAHLVGYEDSNYFCRLFNTMMGVPPSAYRKRLTKEDTQGRNLHSTTTN